MHSFYKQLFDLENVCALFAGNDMAFRTSMVISPADWRKFCLPWHKRFAAMAHEKRILYFFHSFGNIEAIMEDLIEDIRIEGLIFLPV